MADFVIVVPDAKVATVIAAFKQKYHYEEEIFDENGENIPNPESGVVFAKRMLKEHIRIITKKYLHQIEADAILIDFDLEA